MNQLRTRLILIFLAATLAPLAVSLWITSQLVEQSLNLQSTEKIDSLSRSLEQTGRALYQKTREGLKADAEHGRLRPEVMALRDRQSWPAAVEEFYTRGDREGFAIAGANGGALEYMLRTPDAVWVYSAPFGGLGMKTLANQHTEARSLVSRTTGRDIRRGMLYTALVLVAVVWIVLMLALAFVAHRITRPIQRLTEALGELAGGNLDVRLAVDGNDEVARAMRAFNDSAEQLRQQQDRVIQLTRIASWQALARKMAHEVKNSLTPIRLTVEEMVARRGDRDQAFLDEAAQIVVDEVTALERRVRAFSDFASEPAVRASQIDLNALMEERVRFLKNAHPEVRYDLRLAEEPARAVADMDLVKGILTNLLENAAEAAGGGGVVMGKTYRENGQVAVEVHDSGPGLSTLAEDSLFEPTISFKKTGMGLGLSIARRSAVLSGGDILLVKGELGGAGFRVLLPAVN